MALILQIETATRSCSVALAEKGIILAKKERTEANIHASSITIFIQEVLQAAGKNMEELDAIAVSMGPGSYTGLRIGVSTAKGLCYGLNKPLIAIPTLQAMAAAKRKLASPNTILCPMIDARRMEVYMAWYDLDLNEIGPVKAEILDEHTFASIAGSHQVMLFGDGAEKAKSLYAEPAFRFEAHENSAADMSELAYEKFQAGAFEDLAYFEPFYLKDFIATQPKSS